MGTWVTTYPKRENGPQRRMSEDTPSTVRTRKKPSKLCTGHSSITGLPCGNPPRRGLSVCGYHGGSTERSKRAGERNLAADRVRRSLDEVVVREVENPLMEFQSLTSEVVAWKDALASHLAASGGGPLGGELVQLYERALDRSGKFLELWARLGIDAICAAVTARLSESQAQEFRRALEAVVDYFEPSPADRVAALKAGALVLRGFE